MRASSYVSTLRSLEAGTLVSTDILSVRREVDGFSANGWDNAMRLVAASFPGAYCNQDVHGFVADLGIVAGQWLVISGYPSSDGLVWNIQRNGEPDGPEGIEDLLTSKSLARCLNVARRIERRGIPNLV